MDNDFIAFESREATEVTSWDRWIEKASKVSGRDLDGDEDVNGYSLDGAYAAFKSGKTPKEYIASIPAIDFAEVR